MYLKHMFEFDGSPFEIHHCEKMTKLIDCLKILKFSKVDFIPETIDFDINSSKSFSLSDFGLLKVNKYIDKLMFPESTAIGLLQKGITDFSLVWFEQKPVMVIGITTFVPNVPFISDYIKNNDHFEHPFRVILDKEAFADMIFYINEQIEDAELSNSSRVSTYYGSVNEASLPFIDDTFEMKYLFDQMCKDKN